MGEAKRRKLGGTYPTVGVPWPHGLPEAKKTRAREAVAMAAAGDSHALIVERLGFPEGDVLALLLVGDCLIFDETGVASDRLTSLRSAFLGGA